jgi:diguanylate cyclase (GGDEF)-like protein/PAS domain S-box-containing protein
MATPARARLVSRSATALFVGAGAITIANTFASGALGQHGLDTRILAFFGVISITSGLVVGLLLRDHHGAPTHLAIATWGLVLLAASAAWGGSIRTTQAPTAIPVFMMVILVWLALTGRRGLAAGFAPVAIGASALLATLPDSRLDIGAATMVILVSTVVAETIAWAMAELQRREELLATRARTDPLTGLLNRAALADALTDACARGERIVLAFVDLNGFKDVNDSFGHQVGDEVLVEVGRRLERVVHSSDVVARFGGDEFVVLFRVLPPGIAPETLVDRIRGVLAEPWPTIAPAQVGASVGMVDAPGAASTPDELLRAADTAMYSRKHGTATAGTPAELTARALAHHRAAMDGLENGYTVFRRCEDDPDDWTIIAANTRVRSVYRDAAGDPVGRRVSELNRYADNAALGRVLAETLDTNCRQTEEIELAFPDGSSAWRRVTAVPVDRDCVAAITWDITAEREARRLLLDMEQLGTAIVEGAADAIVTIDGRGIVRSFNREAESMFGITRDEIVGNPARTLVPDEALATLRAAAADARSERRFDLELARVDGVRFDANVSLARVTTSSGPMLTATVRDVTQQRAAELALRRALELDDLTGRPNLHSILARTEQASGRAESTGSSVGLLAVDLDRFTLINDSLGHDHGDALLVLVADRLASAVRDPDVVARVSGDHFVVLCEGIDDDDDLVGLATRIHEALRDPFVLETGNEVFVTASIGAARWTGRERPRDLLRFAHTALQRAKHQGPSGVRVFSDDMAVVAASRLAAETALRRALDRDELRAHYQPIIDFASGATESLEALVRWEQPGVGLVQPSEFVGLAEDTGLIAGLGEWMLRRALTDCATWQDEAPGVGVSVNVSVHQVRAGAVVTTLRTLLAELDLAPALVTVEITESVMLEHSDWNLAVLAEIRDLGVRVALDDFGTGYSALTHLRRLPIDTIKIDRAFVADIEGDDRLPTVRAIVELARVHDLSVVAEGVESEAGAALVRAAGCDRGQGFLFGRPDELGPTLARLHAPGTGGTGPDAAVAGPAARA